MNRLYKHLSGRSAALLFSAVGLTCLSIHSQAAQVILTPSADAQVREETPEQWRGSNFIGGTAQTELAVQASATTGNVVALRFNLAAMGITTPAQLEGHADIRMAYRNGGNQGANNAGGFKFYGVLGSAANSTAWNEQSLQYRDAGIHQVMLANNTGRVATQTVIAQTVGAPLNAKAAGGLPPVPPQAPIVPADNTYGANPNALVTNSVPGLKFQYPPYSKNIKDNNDTNYATNVTAYNNYVAADTLDDGILNSSAVAPANYVALQNQPAYNIGASSLTGTLTDVTTQSALASGQSSYALPLGPMVSGGATSFDDVDSSLVYGGAPLGYMNYDSRAARPAGTQLSFTQSLDASMASINGTNDAALVAFLTQALLNGETEVTFLMIQKDALDPLPSRADNVIFASKEFDPDGAGPLALGAWAPQLVIAPEPASLSLIALGGLGMLARRRK